MLVVRTSDSDQTRQNNTTQLEYYLFMANFPGGSAWAMARDIAGGYVLVTARTFERMARTDLDKVSFELERCLRSIRGDQPDLEDIQALKQRNRKMQRLNQARTMLQAVRRKRRI